MNNSKNVIIIGAGIIGVCAAFFLKKDGFKVTLFDQNDPGLGASYGNAGSFSHYGAVSINSPLIFKKIPSYLFSSDSPISIRWNYLPKLLPWIIRFLKNCTSDKMLSTAENLNILLNQSLNAYEEVFNELDILNLYKKSGVIYLWGKDNLEAMNQGINIRNKLGIKQRLLEKSEVFKLEPNISDCFEKAVYFEDSWHATNPRKILLKIYEKFLALGGKFIKEDINQVNEKKIIGKNNIYNFDQLIICSGAFSKKFTRQLGESIPLDTERGYHVHFKDSQNLISHCICHMDSGVYLTPMEQGLRAAGTVELGGLENKPSQKRINYVIKEAKKIIPNLKDPYDQWMGFRPSLPDMLPVISQSKYYQNIFYGFGHQHLGWTLGAITGKILKDQVKGIKSNLNLEPFKSSRFF